MLLALHCPSQAFLYWKATMREIKMFLDALAGDTVIKVHEVSAHWDLRRSLLCRDKRVTQIKSIVELQHLLALKSRRLKHISPMRISGRENE